MTFLRWAMIGLAVWTALSFLLGALWARIFYHHPADPFDEPTRFRRGGM